MKLTSKIDTNSDGFKANFAHHQQLQIQLQQRIDAVHVGGGASTLEYLKKKGKLPVRERITLLLDVGTELLELSPLAGSDLYEQSVPSAGIITGIGMVHGRPCMIIANDPSVKGGTYFPMTVKKHLRAQEIAEANRLPCLHLVDSGGAFLPMQDEVFPDKDDFGRIFFNQARMSANGIQQISAVFGFSTAGGAYIPAMSDQTIIVKGNGSIFLGGPPLVKAATGEDVTADELGGARVHTSISGVADHLAQDDQHAVALMRTVVSHLSRPQKAEIEPNPLPPPPCYSPDELLGIVPRDPKKFFDVREVIARVVDGSDFFEFKPSYGNTLVTGFAQINGVPVGILGNNGILFSECALKATHFIEICCQENKPLIFLQNITGFIVGKKYEHGGIAKDGAKMVHAVANANVPKLTVIIGGSYGAGNYGMCGRAYDPQFLFMWPNARIGVMGGEQAADVLAAVKVSQMARNNIEVDQQQIDQIRKPILEKYDRESSAYYSTARLWDDGIIDPTHTREILAQSLASVSHHRWSETKFGVFRM